jgi:hypothetical protein
MRTFILIVLIAALATLFGVIAWPEKYDLIAGGPVIVRKAMNEEPSLVNALYVLRPGDRLTVVGCVDSKSDVAVRVIVPSGNIGYVGAGEFQLKRVARPVSQLLRLFDDDIVWSCRPFYEDRKLD